MTDILKKMVDADVIVLATPVYFYTMDALARIQGLNEALTRRLSMRKYSVIDSPTLLGSAQQVAPYIFFT